MAEMLSFIGQVGVYAGGSVVIAYALFRYLGRKWIDSHFAESLEVFKHQQALEIARLKVEVESVLSGALKLQEREFSVIPEAWTKMHEAYELTHWVTSPMQTYPDLSRMDTLELSEFLADSELPPSQRLKVTNAEARHRNDEYQAIIVWHRLSKAIKAAGELQKYLSANGIFLPGDLKKQFTDMAALLLDTLQAIRIRQQYGRDFDAQNDPWDKLKNESTPLHEKIEKAIEERLHAHGKCS